MLVDYNILVLGGIAQFSWPFPIRNGGAIRVASNSMVLL
jgi:hypothetical protein